MTDPIWMVHRVKHWLSKERKEPSSRYSAAELEDASLRWTTFTIESYLSYLIPLAKEGIIAFDSLWGPGEMNWFPSWAPLPSVVDQALRATPKEEREVVAEATWATIRARILHASVGTSDDRFGNVLRVAQAHVEPSVQPRRAVEVPILMPFVGPLPVPKLASIRGYRGEDVDAGMLGGQARATPPVELRALAGEGCPR